MHSSATIKNREVIGVLLGVTGVVIFSLTLPATRVAVPVFGGWTVGIGRAVVAGGLAAALLRLRGVARPSLSLMPRLGVTAAGVVIGFPLFSALAMEHVPASRGAVVIGVLPAATALTSTIRNGERPSGRFWIAAAGGMVTVVAFAVLSGGNGRPEPGDALLALAVASAAVGYTEGAGIAAEIGGWQTISWSLVLALPVTTPIAMAALWTHGVVDPSVRSGMGMAYVCVFSMFLGFFAWYAGLLAGGVARVSQLQLLQPMLTLGWSALLLGEELTRGAVATACTVLAFVAVTRRAPIGAGRMDQEGVVV